MATRGEHKFMGNPFLFSFLHCWLIEGKPFPLAESINVMAFSSSSSASCHDDRFDWYLLVRICRNKIKCNYFDDRRGRGLFLPGAKRNRPQNVYFLSHFHIYKKWDKLRTRKEREKLLNYDGCSCCYYYEDISSASCQDTRYKSLLYDWYGWISGWVEASSLCWRPSFNLFADQIRLLSSLWVYKERNRVRTRERRGNKSGGKHDDINKLVATAKVENFLENLHIVVRLLSFLKGFSSSFSWSCSCSDSCKIWAKYVLQ